MPLLPSTRLDPPSPGHTRLALKYAPIARITRIYQRAPHSQGRRRCRPGIPARPQAIQVTRRVRHPSSRSWQTVTVYVVSLAMRQAKVPFSPFVGAPTKTPSGTSHAASCSRAGPATAVPDSAAHASGLCAGGRRDRGRATRARHHAGAQHLHVQAQRLLRLHAVRAGRAVQRGRWPLRSACRRPGRTQRINAFVTVWQCIVGRCNHDDHPDVL